MTERFARAGRPLTENNLRQADLLEGAELLRNQFGTAPGQWIPGDCTILMLPGPPREVYPMFEREVMRRIAGQAGGVAMHTRILRITGLTESYTDSLVGPIYKNLQNPSVTILASPGAIELHLRAIADGRHTADELIADVEEKFRQKLGDRIYGIDDETLEMVVGRKLQVMGCTIATAESCTGGLLTARLTDVPGSSAYLLRGYVCYTNRSKIHDVGVSPELIETFGAVSAPVAEAMASGVRSRSDADLGVSITGIAGPSGGTETKPVGLVYISVATMKRVQTTENRFLGERPIVRFQATQRALDMVRMSLSEESAS